MKIQGLENKIRQTLTGFKQNIKSKEGVIAILENDNQLNLSKLKRLEKEMTYKDDRLLRLDKIIQASALIFQNRLQLITDLKVQLQKEKNKVGASKEYSDHLNGDIDNLEEQKKELTAKIQELEQASQTNSELRDKELKELREEKQRLTEWKEKVSEIIRASLVSVIYPSDASDDDNLLIQAEYTVSQLNE
jgi:chromosome segregation ATPase